MFDQPDTPTAVLHLFPPEYRPALPDVVRSLGGAGGFSGARFWRFEAAAGSLCLRRWPQEHPSEVQLHWMHQVLLHANDAGCEFLPIPISPQWDLASVSDPASLAGSNRHFVKRDGYLWELTAWLPGTPDLISSPSPKSIRAALEALAQFHNATKSFHCVTGSSPGLQFRLDFTGRMLRSQLAQWQASLRDRQHHVHHDACREILRLSGDRLPALQHQLLDLHTTELNLQPCIRDIRPEHVLLDEERVRGIVDFGALRVDNVAIDVARLLGGISGSNASAETWQVGIEAYEELRPLDDTERLAIRHFHRANIALSGLNWVQWLIVEDRQFEDDDAVAVRLSQILATLSTDSDEVIVF